MTSTWTPKFKVEDYLKWGFSTFYIVDINKGYYTISFEQNGPSYRYLYRFGLAIDNGYYDGYRHFDGAILITKE